MAKKQKAAITAADKQPSESVAYLRGAPSRCAGDIDTSWDVCYTGAETDFEIASDIARRYDDCGQGCEGSTSVGVTNIGTCARSDGKKITQGRFLRISVQRTCGLA